MSADYLVATKNQLRGHSKLEVNMKIESLDFKNDSTIEDNGRVYYSGNDYYGNNGEPTTAYATLEKDYWMLDGRKKLLPENNFALQPLISNVMCNLENEFEDTIPTITISAEDSKLQYNIIGFKIVFDTLDNDYASEFDIECYLDGQLTKTIKWVNSSVECDMTAGMTNIDKIKIKFLKMNKPQRRLRIESIFLGLTRKYTNKDIIEASHKWEVDLLSREISDTTFKITVDNRNAKYNADNPSGINVYFQENQPIEIKYYYETKSGEYEIVKGGTLYLDGNPTTEEYEATFEAKGKLYFLSNTYKKGLYSGVAKSYYDLLVDLFVEAGISNYSITESLKNITTVIPLPVLPIKELIQLICNATNTICIEDRSGAINIISRDMETKNYYLDLKNQIEFPVVETQSKLKNVNVSYYQIAEAEEIEEIFNGSFKMSGTKKIQIEYSSSPSIECKATVTNGTILSAIYYSYYCELEVQPTDINAEVVVTIEGRPIEMNKNIHTLEVNVDGEDCDVDNPLVDSEVVATSIANHFKNYLINRNLYISENRGEPCFDVGDIISLETQFSDSKEVAILSNEIDFDGSLTGKTELKSIGG